MKKAVVLSFTIVLALSGCQQAEKPVSKSESEMLRTIIDSSIINKEPEKYNKLFSPALLAGRIAELQGKSTGSGMVKSVTAALNSAAIGQQIIQSMGKGGTYEPVKLYEKESKQHIIYRLYTDGKLNYHDYELGRYKGKACIADMFIYVSGENFSKSLSDLSESMNENGLGNSSGNAIVQVKRLLSAGRYKDANDSYEKLPSLLKDQRSVQLMHVMIASYLGENEYTKAIAEFKKLYPDEPQFLLLMIDANIMNKDYSGALDYVNKVDAMIDKDPFLDYYRGLICRMKGDTTTATTHFESLYKNMPFFSDGVLELIAQYLVTRNFEKATEVASYYKRQKKFNQSTLSLLLMQYPEFKE